MARNYKPGDPILLGLQANQVSWSEHYSNWIYGRGGQLWTRSYKILQENTLYNKRKLAQSLEYNNMR